MTRNVTMELVSLGMRLKLYSMALRTLKCVDIIGYPIDTPASIRTTVFLARDCAGKLR
jgi:hypothetical protein